MPIQRFICRWKDCRQTYEDVEVLFDHLSDDHVGRRSTNNLCLTCAWNGCGATAAKRDHLTSHLKIHFPFKPYFCLICRKNFKRPQDLKKHERIHTIEHQASLLSNQPGYKPVRRRRISTKRSTGTNGIKDTNPTTIGLPALPTLPAFQQSYYSDVSGRFINDNSIIGTTQTDIPDIHGGNTNIGRMSTNNTTLHGNKNWGNDYDPLGAFLRHALSDDCPPPEYDIDMVQRLNSLSYIMQQKQDEITLPISKPDEISALQNWLEQLSANIQTNSDIYPDAIASSQQHHDYSNLTTMLITDTVADSNIELSQCNNTDRPLYPSCDGEFDISNNASSVNTYQTSSFAASSLSPSTCTYTPRNVSPPAATNTLLTTITIPNTNNNNCPEIFPLFWKPGPASSTTSAVELPVMDGPTPSEEIDFSPDYLRHQQQQRQPVIHFETERSDVDPVAVPINKVDISFDSKQEIMQMINAFASPTQNDTSGEVDGDTVCDNLINDDSTDSPDLQTTPTAEKPPSPTANIPASVMMMTLPSPTTANTELSITETSPYADLVDQLQNISLQHNDIDDDDEVDGKLRKRHAQVLDLLWRATLRKTLSSPLLSKSSSYTVPT